MPVHVRVSEKRRGTRVYRYAQLVQSYRRPDGVPAHRVVGSLGRDLSDQDVENLNLAFRACRTGKRVAVINPSSVQPTPPQTDAIYANLKYLDVALALHYWNSWQLTPALDQLAAQSLIDFGQVVCGLTLQRCIAPGSKLYAQRWYPTTALPELLGLSSERFNNTRIHRALELLEQITPALQEHLIQQYAAKCRRFVSLFIDVTDTWFVGRGPEMAQPAKTKEGLFARRIGIALLCNELGYPLKWNVLPGKQQDGPIMIEMAEALKEVPWAQGMPFVADRSLGKRCYVERLQQTNLHYLVPIPNDEWSSYCDAVPYHAFVELIPKNLDQLVASDIQAATEAARRAGMQQLGSNFVLDFGVVQPANTEKTRHTLEAIAGWSLKERMELSLQWNQQLNAHQATLASLARASGHTKSFVKGIVRLGHLAPSIQTEILAGGAEAVSFTKFRELSRLKPAAQVEAFAQLLKGGPSFRPTAPHREPTRTSIAEPVRVVVYFNPQMFIQQRQAAEKRLLHFEAFLKDLNRRLQTPQSRRNVASVYAEVGRELKQYDMFDAFEIGVTTKATDHGERFQVALERKEEAWQRRRRHDGFCLLIAHPAIGLSATEIIDTFHAKDAVEKDFQTIKSAIKLRPVRHHTDAKVIAHVSLCMLGLLLDRTIEQHLRRARRPLSAQYVFEALATCHLNMIGASAAGPWLYTLTQPTRDQRALLKTLRLSHLIDDVQLRKEITPR